VGSNTTGTFHAVPNCRWAMVEIGLDARRCSSDLLATEHPVAVEMAPTGGSLVLGWCNALATWSGGNWLDLQYTAHSETGEIEGAGFQAISGLHIQCRVTGGGDMEFRIHNASFGPISAVIMGALRVTGCPQPPGTVELGDYCCHEDDWEGV
jgi:hypothetical protein